METLLGDPSIMETQSDLSGMDLLKPRLSPSRGLRPFDHQVAGQSLIISYDQSTICKCLIQREYQFYQAVPRSLQPFVPQFKGVVQLYVPDSDHSCSIDCSCDRSFALGWKQTPCPSPGHKIESLSVEPSRRRALRKTTRRGGDGINSNLYYFILLEDLMSRFRKPCILDLKVGVRQHGDDAPPEKVEYQINKCKTTTSASLGVRLCGMKRYDFLTGKFEVQDKIYGRQLNDDDFRRQIVQFLYNGQDLRLELVQPIIQRLTSLKSVVEQLDGFRFYSCSLLIIYEGSQGDFNGDSLSPLLKQEEEDSLECDSEQNKNSQRDNDDNGVTTDRTLVTLKNQTEAEETQGIFKPCHNAQTSTHTPIGGSGRNGDKSSQDLLSSEGEVLNCCNTPTTAGHEHFLVDIRVVDFAHATFNGFLEDQVKHCGPDNGFLLGLSTLLEIFTELRDRQVIL